MPKLNALKLGAIAAAVVGMSSFAMAADLGGGAPKLKAPVVAETPVDVLFSLAVTSDYITRGATQTNHGAAVQGSVEVDLYQFYASLWASNVTFASGENLETDWALGWRPTVGPFNLDLGYVYYLYSPFGSSAGDNFSEAYLKATINPIMPLTLGASFFINPVNSATYIEANAAYMLPYNLKLSGAVGSVNNNPFTFGDYVTWNAGLSYTWNDLVTLDGRYWDATSGCEDTMGNTCGSRFVATLSIATTAKKLGLIH